MSDTDKPETLEDALARIEVLTEQLKKVRGEAAEARVSKRDALEKVKSEAQAEFEAKLAELRKQQDDAGAALNQSKLTNAQLTAALNAVVPDVKDKIVEVASRLIGSNDEELAKDADRVKALFGLDTTPAPARVPAVDPSQGAGNQGGDLALNGDPLLNSVMRIVGRGR